MITPINHAELAEQRLATQFREANNLINYIKTLLRENDDLEQVFQDLCNNRYIDTAEGVQLDIIGDIVGQPREFTIDVVDTYFGLQGSIGGDTFGTTGDSNVGANFRSLSDVEFAETVFTDEKYRIFIRSKIAKNKTKVIINEIIDVVLQGVTSSNQVTVTETMASFRLTFVGSLSDEDKLLLSRTDFVPKPAGINFSLADDNGVFM